MMAKGDAALLRALKDHINSVPRRGGEREALRAIQKMRVLILEPSPSIMPCPACGHPLDVSYLGGATHVEHGYREPHIKPYLPGSWLAEKPEGVPPCD